MIGGACGPGSAADQPCGPGPDADRATRRRGAPDLRLAGITAGTWLSSLAALHMSAQAAAGVALAVTLATVAGVIAAARAGRRVWKPPRRLARQAGIAALDRAGWWVWEPSRRLARPNGAAPLGRAGWWVWEPSRRLARPNGAAPLGRTLDRRWPGRSGSDAVRLAGMGGWRWAGLAVLLGVVCGSATTAARVAARDAEPLAGLAARQASVLAELVIRDDPRQGGDPGGRPLILVPADIVRAEWDRGRAARLRARVLVLAGDGAWQGLLPGQRVSVSGRLMPARGGDLRSAVLSATGPPRLFGRPGWFQRAAGALRGGLRRACDPLPDEPGGLLPGLVVGDTSRLPRTVAEDFRATGLTHLVAVSGANVAIVVGLVLSLVRWTRAGPRVAAAASALALAGFVILARPSPSVLRAAVMGSIGLIALASGRHRAAVPALCAAVTVLVVVDPELAGHPGFALSVLATAGLLLVAPRWRDALLSRGVPAGIAEAIAVPAAAQMTCAPVVAALSGTVSAVAVPANLLAVPAVAPATVLGVCAAVASPVWPAGAGFLAWLAGWPARWLVAVARYGSDAPAAALPWFAGAGGGLLLAGVVAALLFAGRWRVVRRTAAVVAVAAVLGALPVRLVASGWPPAGWVIVVCSVGQGDAAALPAGRGGAVVVDAGADPASADRCLRRLGVRRVPVLAVSHLHADHVDGVNGVFRGRRVGVVVTGALPEPASGRAQLERAAAGSGVTVRVVGMGWSYAGAGLRLTALGPPALLRNTRSDPNNNSLVLYAVVDGVGILLPGDAESEEQRALLEHPAGTPTVRPGTGLRAQVLKVPHHGSGYQDRRFLDTVDPVIALVSVGVGNRYGHPDRSVLAGLSSAGARVLRTDVDGDLAAVRTGGGLAVVARGRDPGKRTF